MAETRTPDITSTLLDRRLSHNLVAHSGVSGPPSARRENGRGRAAIAARSLRPGHREHRKVYDRRLIHFICCCCCCSCLLRTTPAAPVCIYSPLSLAVRPERAFSTTHKRAGGIRCASSRAVTDERPPADRRPVPEQGRGGGRATDFPDIFCG